MVRLRGSSWVVDLSLPLILAASVVKFGWLSGFGITSCVMYIAGAIERSGTEKE